jgi:hypothetical protein
MTLHTLPPGSELWHLEVNRPDEHWSVLGRIAWEKTGLPARDISFSEIGLDPQQKYLVFDFWNEKFVGEAQGSFPADALPEGNCRVYGIRPLQSHPQVLGTKRPDRRSIDPSVDQKKTGRRWRRASAWSGPIRS